MIDTSLLEPQECQKEINAIEYKKIRMEQDQKKQADRRLKCYQELDGNLTLQSNLQTGYNNAIKALDHVIFEDEEVDDYIASCNASAATRSIGEPDEKPAVKRRNTGKGEEV